MAPPARLTRRARVCLIVGAAIVVGACPTSRSQPLAPEQLTPLFRLSGFRRAGAGFFYGLSVFSCHRDRVYWTMGGNGTKTGVPDTIRYGNPPPGYETSIGPVPLTPGCYTVLATARAPMQLLIDSAGRATAPYDPDALVAP